MYSDSASVWYLDGLTTLSNASTSVLEEVWSSLSSSFSLLTLLLYLSCRWIRQRYWMFIIVLYSLQIMTTCTCRWAWSQMVFLGYSHILYLCSHIAKSMNKLLGWLPKMAKLRLIPDTCCHLRSNRRDHTWIRPKVSPLVHCCQSKPWFHRIYCSLYQPSFSPLPCNILFPFVLKIKISRQQQQWI